MDITRAMGNVPLSEFEYGSVFSIGKDYYMKVSGATSEAGVVLAVNLDYGGLVRFKEQLEVTRVDCELFVKS